MVGVVGLAAHRLDDETTTENLRVLPHIVADDIAVVHPHIQPNGPLFLQVPPGGNGHSIIAARGHLDHEEGFAQQPRIEHRPRQAVGRVAAVVFGRGQDGAAATGGGDHGLTGAHGDPQRLFDQGVFARLKSRYCHLVMHGAIRYYIHRTYVRACQNLVQIGEDQGLAPEAALDLACPEFGILAPHIAHRHQIDIADAAVFQHPVGHDVTVSHAAAADQTKGNLFHKLAPRFL